MNLKKLKLEIEYAVKKSFTEILKNKPNIYSFALYSDENCESLSVAANTLKYLKNAKEENEESEFDHYSKYSPEEWDYSIDGAEKEFSEISKSLSKHFLKVSSNNDNEEFDSFQSSFYNTCIDVLVKLKAEGFFKTILEKEIFITFCVTEYEFENPKQKEIITKLNNNEFGQEYLKWMKSWENN